MTHLAEECEWWEGGGGEVTWGRGVTSFLCDGDLIHESGPGDSDACLGSFEFGVCHAM